MTLDDLFNSDNFRDAEPLEPKHILYVIYLCKEWSQKYISDTLLSDSDLIQEFKQVIEYKIAEAFSILHTDKDYFDNISNRIITTTAQRINEIRNEIK